MISLYPLPLLVGIRVFLTSQSVVGRECELGCDLLEGVLGFWETELQAEEGRFGGLAFGRLS